MGLGFSRSLIALLSSHLFLARLPCPGTCLDQAGARFGLVLAPGFLSLLRLSLPGGHRTLKQVDLSRLDRYQFGFWGGSISTSSLEPDPAQTLYPPAIHKSICSRLETKSASGQDGCQVWIGSGMRTCPV